MEIWAADKAAEMKRERPASPLWRILSRRYEAQDIRAKRRTIDDYRAWLEEPDRATLLAREIEGLREAASYVDERFGPEEDRRVFASDVDGGEARYWVLRRLELNALVLEPVSDERSAGRVRALRMAKDYVARLPAEHEGLRELAALGVDSDFPGGGAAGEGVRGISAPYAIHPPTRPRVDDFEQMMRNTVEGVRWDISHGYGRRRT